MNASKPEKGKIISFRVVARLKKTLVDEGLVTKEQLTMAAIKAQQEDETLGKVLIKLGFVTEEQLIKFIGDKMEIPYVNIKNYTIDRKVLELIPEKIARHYKILPLFKIENVLTIAMPDPLDVISLDEISAVVEGYKVEPVIASSESIQVAIDQWYGVGTARQGLIDELVEEFADTVKEEERKPTREMPDMRLRLEAEDAPIVRLVNSLIVQAMLEEASDIHLEPQRDSMAVRFRIDGFLYHRQELPLNMTAPITARIKIMSGLDISKKRIPQDGRMGLIIRDKNIDIRTSTFPSMHGENVVLRILDKSRETPTLSELGFSEEDLIIFRKMIKATKGIILATGPTGSGKTTTIYSAINALSIADKNVMTIEDPIEYEIRGVVQSQVNIQAGITFANALRSILRQDPDIIYVGEIRDRETAEIAVHSALTGHLVLSTLHTNDAVGAIMRLCDIGIEPVLLESVFNCSFAQRLVRKICPKCKKEYQPDESLLKRLGFSLSTKFYKGEGCEACGGIGYRGRIGIFEILVVNKDIRALIVKRASEDKIMEVARSQGMKTLFEDGLLKVMKGITTLEEIMRVIEEAE